MLLATTACTFSTRQLPKVVRPWCVFYILAWTCASRHSGVHNFQHLNFEKFSEPGVLCIFWLRNVLRATMACAFISHLPRRLGTHRSTVASPLLDPPEPQIIGEHNVSRLCYLFAHLHLLSSGSFSSLIFFLLLFSSLTLPTSPFSSVHNVGSLTSKLPSFFINTIIILTSHSYIVQQNISFWWIY